MRSTILNRFSRALLAMVFCLKLSSLAHADPFTHPRLFFTESDETELKARIKTDPLVAKLYAELIRRSDFILTTPPTKHYIKDGRRLLSESRYALKNILHTGMAWRMSGDEKYLKRAIQELHAACSFKDWNPSHFLDTAEMSTAVAIGYDWLYHDLTPAQRNHFSTSLTKLGLDPARKGYSKSNRTWWSTYRSNWTQVCAAGLLITERALEKKGEPLHKARLEAKKILDDCRAFYQPSGGYPEGPGYWHYGSNYHVLGLATIQTDRKEMAIQTPTEFKRSALFNVHLTGPTETVFNFADSGSSAHRSKIGVAQSWMIREFSDPSSIQYLRDKIEQDILYMKKHHPDKGDRLFPMHLLWLPQATQQPIPPFSLDSKWLGSQPIATFRCSWTDPDTMFLAIKGGLPKVSHGHMDIGSFVFESDGVRWVEDLGSDNYNLPGYFGIGAERWKFFRLNNLSHNTLVIGGKLQTMEAETSPLTDFQSKPNGGNATLDMTRAYAGQAEKISRKANFDRENKKVTLTDTITAPTDSVRWAIITIAEIEINGSVATLNSNGKTLRVIRNDKHGGEWEILNAKPPTTKENQNEGFQILSFTAPVADQLKLSVTLKPE